MPLITFNTEWLIRILIAVLCGSIIGYERENRNKEAGIRTHAIISLGSAVFMIISKYGFSDIGQFDAARVAAQIVSGVGFLGTGVIFLKHGTVSGLTTAAGMWATSGVGSCIGAGLYDIGILTTGTIVGLQFLFHISVFHNLTAHEQLIQIYMEKSDNSIIDILQTVEHMGVSVQSIKVDKLDNKDLFLEFETCGLSIYGKDKFIAEITRKEYIYKFNLI